MNITPIKLFGINNNYASLKKQTPLFIKNNGMDTVSFSGVKYRSEVLRNANTLKEQMEECYAAVEAECSLSSSDVKTFTERYGTKEAFMTLRDETKKDGTKSSKSAVFKEGRLQKVVVLKTKNKREVEKETYYFDDAGEELKRYVAVSDNNFFGKISSGNGISNVSRVEYEYATQGKV